MERVVALPDSERQALFSEAAAEMGTTPVVAQKGDRYDSCIRIAWSMPIYFCWYSCLEKIDLSPLVP